MPPDQKLITPLVEQNLRLEPATPIRMSVTERIQRSWSLLFGRRGGEAWPLRCLPGGALCVQEVPLSDCTLVKYGVISGETETDLGQIVDFVKWCSLYNGLIPTRCNGGLATGVVLFQGIPEMMTLGSLGEAAYYLACSGRLEARVQFIKPNGYGAPGYFYYAAYTYNRT